MSLVFHLFCLTLLNVQCSPLRQGLATASPGYLGKQTGNSKITSAKQWQNAKIQNNHCKIVTMMQDFIIKHFVSSVTSERIVSDSATFSTSLRGTFLENLVFFTSCFLFGSVIPTPLNLQGPQAESANSAHFASKITVSFFQLFPRCLVAFVSFFCFKRVSQKKKRVFHQDTPRSTRTWRKKLRKRLSAFCYFFDKTKRR